MQPALAFEPDATPGLELVSTAPLPAPAPEQLMLRMLEVVTTKIDAVHAGQRAVVADLRDIKAHLPIPRRPLSGLTMELHIQVTWHRRGGYCPLCSATQVCTESTRVGDAEFDHFVQRSNPRPTATWLICKPCHIRITSDTNAKTEAAAAFRVYQGALKSFLSNRQLLLTLPEGRC